MKIVLVDEGSEKKRLDIVAGANLTSVSRSYIAKLIADKKIMVNGSPTKAGYKLRTGDTISIDFDEQELDKIPSLDLPVLYEDDAVIVINKPSGIISHSRGRYWDEPSVASFLRQKLKDVTDERSGIVHRLDRATSGVMICAKNAEAQAFLQKQFAARAVQKSYLAVCEGRFAEKAAIIDAPIARNPKKPTTFMVSTDGKPARTEYTVLNQTGTYSFLRLLPLTGRTHQLRVHLQFIHHPILGDAFYGNESNAPRLMLHAEKLVISLPGNIKKEFFAPIPKEFESYA